MMRILTILQPALPAACVCLQPANQPAVYKACQSACLKLCLQPLPPKSDTLKVTGTFDERLKNIPPLRVTCSKVAGSTDESLMNPPLKVTCSGHWNTDERLKNTPSPLRVNIGSLLFPRLFKYCLPICMFTSMAVGVIMEDASTVSVMAVVILGALVVEEIVSRIILRSFAINQASLK